MPACWCGWRLAGDGSSGSTPSSKSGPRRARICTRPDLLPYELESALRSLVFAGELSEAQAIEGLERIGVVPLTLHPHPGGARLLRTAGRQGTRLAYDSAYLVLAEGLGADLWTADRRLANNGRSLGIKTQFIGDAKDDPSRA